MTEPASTEFPEDPSVPVEHQKPVAMLFSNRTYDILKPIVQVVLPGAGTLYFTLATIWGFSNPEKIVGTIAAINVFLGLLLSLSTRVYNRSDAKYDGVINVLEAEDGTKTASLELKNYENPAEVVQQKEVTFKVNPQ